MSSAPDQPSVDHLMAQLRKVGLAAGLVGIAATVVVALVDYHSFVEGYLFAFLFWVAVPIGALFLVMIHHLVRGRWGAVLRRPLEAAAVTIPLFALLFVPIALNLDALFPWASGEIVAHSEKLRHKELYLNIPFFLGRAGFYFVVWTALAVILRRVSLREDRQDEPVKFRSMLRKLCGLGLVLVAITDSFALVDWAQSLEPEWFSSQYPLMMVIGQLLTATSFFLLAALYFSRTKALSKFVNADLFNDLSNILLVFVVLWAYTEFVQLIIIWSGDKKDAIPWYVIRSAGGWAWVIVAVVIFQFGGPLFGLFFKKLKRRRRSLTWLVGWVFVVRFVDYYWLIIPAFHPSGFELNWAALAAWAAIGGIWLVVFGWVAARAPLMGRSSKELFDWWRHEHRGGDHG